MKIAVLTLVALLVLVGIGFALLYFSPRPPLTIDPTTLAGDGSTINYCDLPVLDGSGLRAADIAKANTPGCAYTHFPLPVLRACTEPLPPETDDLRGLWRGISGRTGHVERIEQCGARTVITSSGIIHDSGPNSTAGFTTNDTEGSVLFTLRGKAYCSRTSAGMVWNDGVLDFKVFGWGPVVVRRYKDGEHLVWEYVDGSVTRMERLCTLPDQHKVPAPRGPRYAL